MTMIGLISYHQCKSGLEDVTLYAICFSFQFVGLSSLEGQHYKFLMHTIDQDISLLSLILHFPGNGRDHTSFCSYILLTTSIFPYFSVWTNKIYKFTRFIACFLEGMMTIIYLYFFLELLLGSSSLFTFLLIFQHHLRLCCTCNQWQQVWTLIYMFTLIEIFFATCLGHRGANEGGAGGQTN